MRKRIAVYPAAAVVALAAPHPADPTTAAPKEPAGTQERQKIQRLQRQLYRARLQLRRRWRPTVTYALRLASAVSGVSYWQLRGVAYCESTLNPYAVNGRYRGLFQLSWTPFGFDPYDPVANALSAALTVRHDGGWRQWECKP